MKIDPPSPEISVKFLPKRIMDDLIKSGGRNIKSVKTTLLDDLGRQYERAKKRLDEAIITAEVIATALDQPKDSTSHAMAQQLLEDYQPRCKDDFEFFWSVEKSRSTIAEALIRSMEVM